MSAKTVERREPVVKAKLPLVARWSIMMTGPHGVAPLTVLWCSAGRFSRRPDSADPAWRILRVGPFVIALRL